MSYLIPEKRPIKGLDEAEKRYIVMQAEREARKLMSVHSGKPLFLVLVAEAIMKTMGPIVDKEMGTNE